MKMRTTIVGLLLVLSLMLGAGKGKLAPAADTPVKKKPSGKAAAARLRAEWDVGELRMMRLVVDDAQVSPELKVKLGDTVDKFAQQQEELLDQVEADPSTEAAVQKRRAKLYAAYMDKMQAVDKEIDSIYASAETLMSKLDAVGVTPEQKAKIAPVVKEANKKVKAEVD